ncbi:AbrB/MazE/SpoVT family DNA-binding domain-containing protein [Duganella sp. FT50W]|uniref:AbrB/MazE/SpoVT family DNA-binding domain-containing protein n=2 Tax=Duganella lactea TaxID=2692173 RepID=A0A6L8MN30_9BURK|nr:AbrB/MazE/SpoVT family DNA-binding domain-containing protein [Duganella lactea]
MMVTMTSKGRITLPKKLRDQLGLVPGARLAFSLLGDGSVVMRVKHRRLSSLAGILTRPDQPTISIDNMKR